MNPEQSGESRARRVGPYLLEELLGSGGMGTVWRAWDERLRRPVAVKQVLPEKLDHPAARERLRHEAAAGARLNHPAIVHVYDILETRDGEWIVMELVEGRTLKDLLQAGPLDLVQAIRLAREISKGLGKAHARGVVHRDLKTSNVMVTHSGHAKILDFGIAKLLDTGSHDSHDSDDFTVTPPGALLGTPHAMSPEQILGWPLDHRSDLFSFGILLYEMLTQTSPFLAETSKATVRRVCRHRPPPVRQLRPEVPPELSELADWLLEKEPQHRPQETREVAAVLGAILARLVQERSGELPLVLPRRRAAAEESTILLGPAREALLAAGERRQVTVICCGLMEVGNSWDSAETRFPGVEDLAEVIPELRLLAGEIMEHFGGQLGPVLGHFLWSYFGIPQAQGDDARRAVQAAWELLSRVRQSQWSRRGEARLTLRVGIHSGPTVVPKDCPPPEQIALGPTLDVATGLQSLTPADEVIVSEATRRLIARSFETEPLPPVRLPGSGESAAVFRVSGLLDSAEQALRASKALVARQGELDLLFQRWQLVLGGESQVVLVSGEAGIGKSRLVSALREELGALAPRWLFCYGVPHARSSPFHPIIELLRRTWLQEALSPPDKLAVLENLLRQSGLPVEEDLAILAALLSLPTSSPLCLTPEAQRQRTLEALFNLLIQATMDQPMVLVVEDLHWLDPSTLELIGALLDGIGDGSLLMILTFRLELKLPWAHRASWTQLSLGRLTDGDAFNLIDQVPGGDRLPKKIRQEIVAKSDGVPLFVEELTRSAVEAEGATSELLGLPGLLRDSLTARLDRLGRAKEVAQLAAVIGRSFSFELLAAVSPLDRTALLKELDRLVRAELLVRRGTGERGTYGFKHTLLQEAACELLLPQDLERLHGRIAEVLETQFPEIAAGQPESVAFHYTEARQPEKAIELWLRAGQKALQRFATQEALEHFRSGLRLVEALPEGPQRDRLELSLRISSAPAVIASRGHSGDEAEALFDRALALGQQLGDMPNPFQSLLWSFYTWRGDLEKAKNVATQMLVASKERRDVEGLILGLQELATVHAHLGRPRSALRALKRALELYPAGPSSDGARAPLFSGWDAKCHNLCEAARAMADAGYPDRALRYGRRGLRLAESLADPYATTLAFQSLSFIHHLRREYPEASQHARWMHDLCLNQGFTFFAAHGRFLLSLTRAMLALSENPESPEDAVVLVGEAIQALDVLRRDHHQELDFPELLGWLAEVCIHCGMTSEARWLLEDAFEISNRTGERLGRAELHRLQGRLLLADAEPAGDCLPAARSLAEGSFLQALAEARSSESRWLELRAAMDLARLWHRQGRDEPARDLLADVVESFAEGWETADLRAARDLLGELGAA